MPNILNSLRMRAECEGKHISGAERLLETADLGTAAVELIERALNHPRGAAEKIYLQVDPVPARQVATGTLPDLHNHQVGSWQQGRKLAQQLLEAAGISRSAAIKALQTLAAGAAPGGNSMRGAMLIDAASGERLEADQARGVRVSRMDLSCAARDRLLQRLKEHGLNNSHVVEALTLAAKVIAAPGVLAELCWSDDPDYLAGYVASPQLGYRRINHLKPVGEERGGRAFFIDRSQVELGELVSWLEQAPLLIDQIGAVHPPQFCQGER